MRAAPLLLALALALTACGRGAGDQGKTGLSPNEDRQLDAAAAAIDVNASNGAQP